MAMKRKSAKKKAAKRAPARRLPAKKKSVAKRSVRKGGPVRLAAPVPFAPAGEPEESDLAAPNPFPTPDPGRKV